MKARSKFPANTLTLIACCFSQSLLFTAIAQAAESKPKIAIFSGPTATIQNNKPLITREPLKYSQFFGKIAQSKTSGETHEPINLC